MPDIKTAMANILNDWAADDTPFVPKVIPPTQPEPATMNTPTAPTLHNASTSVSEQTFNFVRDNPYISIHAAIKALTDMGLNENSTGSLIYQMIRCGMLSRDKDDRLTALQKKYTPVQTKRNATKLRKNSRTLRTPRTPRTEPVVLDLRQDKAEGIAALSAPVAQPTPATVTATPLMTAEQVLKTLSVKEAHALYRELQTMFG